jgi:hypothetical protein
MNPDKKTELRWRYLLKLYELSEGGLHPEIDYKLVQSELGYSSKETRSVVDYLESKDLVSFKCRVPCIQITTRGIDKVERIMAETYAEKMRKVLEKIYEMAGPDHTNEVSYFALQRELEMNGRELNPILKDFEERRGWLGESSDESVCLSPEGVLEVENSRVERRGIGGDIYQTNIHAPIYGGILQGGQSNTQTNTVNFHSKFESAISQLIFEIERALNLLVPFIKLKSKEIFKRSKN